MITIVDSGLGNIGSVANMLNYIGVKNCISCEATEISNAQSLILPGVGAFDNGMTKLKERNLIEPLRIAVIERKAPILGICLGMHLLGEGSVEGVEAGLGWIKGRTIKFELGENPQGLRIPHMGWNEVDIPKAGCLFPDITELNRFYFVHSYHFFCDDKADIAATAHYGTTVTAAVERGNIFGTQFHPEKSHKYGMRILKSFFEQAKC